MLLSSNTLLPKRITPSSSTSSTTSNSTNSSSSSLLNKKSINQTFNSFSKYIPNVNMKSTPLSTSSDQNKFQFKPIVFSPIQQQQLDLSNSSSAAKKNVRNSFLLNSSQFRSENLVNNLLHTTSKDGKIYKRRSDKTNRFKKYDNLSILECYNLSEKEKFRQMLSQNLARPSAAQSSLPSVYKNKNLYQNYIRSSPTKIRDDNNYEMKNHNKNEVKKINCVIFLTRFYQINSLK